MTKNKENRIVIDPKVMTGKPVIKGTRITVELVLRLLAQGVTVENILENYPHLKRGDILAAIEYATELVEEERVYPLHQGPYGKAKAVA